MRIMIKGGVWKNTEDEILKAAVMKYGLNQWARISSLLVRKSAKQCKARWYEWLDPSIKKTEWTREEDEKLLHLAKLMPTQWRTIAPIVGRTPAQCLERYEKLLDAAAAKDDNYEPSDDPRRLRPGEIDPNPEAKPARPDPIDMDEDEKEMLSEARARLANTKGKKAKRKAREKQLEEARRLAALQKKRELRAAGIEMREKNRRSRGINYNNEVAFEKRPAPGFFDTAGEQATTREVGREFRPTTVEEIEGKRPREIEAALVKKDIEHAKLKAAHNVPAAVAKNLALNDPTMQRKRGRMMLPAPQISEAELEAIARGGGQPELDPEALEGAGGDTTRRLLGNYETPARFATPMRTPRAEGIGGRDRILAEAQNLQKLTSAQTPLFGGENPELHASDFAGITPRNTVPATPHPLAAAATPQVGSGGETPLIAATPGRSVAGIAASTPRLGGSLAGTPLRTPGGGVATGATPTPLRDALGLNDRGAGLPAETARLERARQAAARSELRDQFDALPAASFEYEIAVPELPDDAAAEDGIEEDAADAAVRRKAEAAARAEAELRLRSQVLQRALPRPSAPELVVPLQPEADASTLSYEEAADQLLRNELAALVKYDNAAYPVKEKKGKRKREAPEVAPLERFEEGELAAAKLLIEEEAQAMRAALGHPLLDPVDDAPVWEAAEADWIFLPASGRWQRKASATNTDRLASLQSEFAAALEEMKRQAERAHKLESKVKLLTQGLVKRGEALEHTVEETREVIEDAERSAAAFAALAARETVTIPNRRAAAEAAVAEQRARESALQKRYKALNDQLIDLRRAAAADTPAEALPSAPEPIAV